MHISHNFIATKTCSGYEFLVVFGQVRVWDWKSTGRNGLRGGCRLEVCRCKQNISNSYGCGHKISTRAGL